MNRNIIKGYPVEAGYMGYVDGRKMLFATENEYRERMEETEENASKKKETKMKSGDKYYRWSYDIWKDGKPSGMSVGVYGTRESRDEKVNNLLLDYPESEGYELKYIHTEEFTFGE